MTIGMPQAAIELDGVTRLFGDIRAVDQLTLEVPRGTVAVLLGPNGAGKTTTVRLITGALGIHSGTLRVAGMDPATDGSAVRRRCGVVPPKPAMYDQLTGRENLAYTAEIYGVEPASADAAAKQFGIDHALEQEVGGYSTGMRTRLALARAILHDPDVLLLDEPTAGLDPESARAVLDMIRDLAGLGRTIVMCTHLLHEAEGIADQVVLMRSGQARAVGDPAQLASKYLAEPTVIFDAENRPALDGLVDHPAVREATWNEGLHVKLDSIESLPELVRQLVGDGARITRVEPVTPTLENLYFEMQKQMGGDR